MDAETILYGSTPARDQQDLLQLLDWSDLRPYDEAVEFERQVSGGEWDDSNTINLFCRDLSKYFEASCEYNLLSREDGAVTFHLTVNKNPKLILQLHTGSIRLIRSASSQALEFEGRQLNWLQALNRIAVSCNLKIR